MANEVFDLFCNATTLKSILGHFRHLCDLLKMRPNTFPQFYPKFKSKLRSWKAQALWKKFDQRANHKCYNRGKACPNTRVGTSWVICKNRNFKSVRSYVFRWFTGSDNRRRTMRPKIGYRGSIARRQSRRRGKAGSRIEKQRSPSVALRHSRSTSSGGEKIFWQILRRLY